jgi:hypothetical protein
LRCSPLPSGVSFRTSFCITGSLASRLLIWVESRSLESERAGRRVSAAALPARGEAVSQPRAARQTRPGAPFVPDEVQALAHVGPRLHQVLPHKQRAHQLEHASVRRQTLQLLQVCRLVRGRARARRSARRGETRVSTGGCAHLQHHVVLAQLLRALPSCLLRAPNICKRVSSSAQRVRAGAVRACLDLPERDSLALELGFECFLTSAFHLNGWLNALQRVRLAARAARRRT